MHSFFIREADYFLFLDSLFLFVTASICFLLVRVKRIELPWKQAGYFFLAQGINELLGVFTFDINNITLEKFDYLRYFLLVLSLLFIGEFSRKSLSKIYPRFRINIFFGFLYFFTLLFLIIPHNNPVNTPAAGYPVVFFSIIAGVTALMFARNIKKKTLKAAFLTAVISFLFYSLAGLFIVEKNILSYKAWQVFFEFLKLIAGLNFTIGLYIYYSLGILEQETLNAPRKNRHFLVIVFQSAIFILASFFLINSLGRLSAYYIKSEILKRDKSAASVIDAEKVKNLTGFKSDEETSDFEELREKLIVLHKANPDYRFVYLVRAEANKAIFLVDSEPMDSEDYSYPGQVWNDAPKALFWLYVNRRPAVYGPYTDDWGTWVSSFVPIMDKSSGGITAALVFDIDAKIFFARISLMRFYGIVISLVFFILLLSMFIINEIIQANMLKLIGSEERFRFIFDFAPGGILVVDAQDKKIISANRQILNMLGYKLEEILALKLKDINLPDFLNEERFFNFDENNIALFEHDYIKKDGISLPVEILATKIIFQEKKSILIFVTDITQRKHAENALKESEEKYRKIFENASEGIFQTTPEGRYISLNPAFAKMFGFESPEEMKASIHDIGKQLYVDSQDRENLKRDMEEKGYVENFETQLYRKDKSKFWVSINARAVRNSQGKILYYEGTDVDITAHKEAEERLKEKEKLYRTLAENLPDIVYRVFIRESWRMEFFNNMLVNITGYTAEELKQGEVCSIDPLIHPDDRRAVIYVVKNAVDYNRPFTVKYRLIRKDGTTCYCMERGRPIMGSDGAPLYIEGIIYDISELKQIENKLKETLKDLQKAHEELKNTKNQLIQSEKLALLGRLSAGIAHEIRNPLGIIQGAAEFLEGECVSDKIDFKEIFKKMNDSIGRIDKIINGLLSFAKVPVVKFEKVPPVDLINTVLSLLEYRFHLSNISILFVPKGQFLPFEIDKTQIEQVISNVIINAMDAMPEGGSINIELNEIFRENHSGQIKSFCEIIITDTGKGMSNDELDNIFQPFFTSKDIKKGTGLGLYISKLIIDNHHGFMSIESTPGKGTVVKIQLLHAQ